MEEGRRYKVVKVEKSEKAKDDIVVGASAMAIGAIAIALSQYTGGLVYNNFPANILPLFGLIEVGRGMIDVLHGLMAKTDVEVPDEVVERYDNEKGRGAK